MKPTRNRLVGLAAALSTIAIAAPVSTASAGWGGFAAVPFTGPATVTGPVVITTAPSSFINSNTQVSAGGNLSGVQVGP